MNETRPNPANECPFCRRLSVGPLTGTSLHGAAFPDGFPLTSGHHLIVPRRHVEGFFELTEEEQAGLWRLLLQIRETIQVEHEPDGFNVGINAGAAAGQSVGHAHMHLIPRYKGDVEDPRGGVRWVVPANARYWQHQEG